ncbi:diaminopropionate ammonia-lyase [Paraburkholderia tropica]|uniref:diaminopropionate ammonia-lyase n=1 Tax=Paraburkholderia tropica TaxID=92647 RepID=UPI0007ECFF5C|nr:diaminopropionate ammonia-lyase [Paraburkholderia tropica]MBB2979119.1 diaminopropionate ammonia-lyase [Paraburkholderia tropica]OBR51031.1 diaminopropionate ammonia-lyase [Paraburkholderia tropica]
MLIANPRATCAAYPSSLQTILNVRAADESGAWLSSWGQLSRSATPLWDLPDAASALGIARLSVKDEGLRSPLGSFKALGAPIALTRLILRLWHTHELNPQRLLRGDYADLLASLTVISATDGNHGKALAAAARDIGCQCVIVLHANVSREREDAIAHYGARIVRIEGDYDASVEHAATLAADNQWHVVSDTSYEGYETIPRDVMQGYGVIAAETLSQLDSPVTHVFLQGGVGGLAAGVASYLWEHFGAQRPQFIVVEPQQADCLYQSAMAGRATRATGSVDSVMAGLACGEASPLAWKILEGCIDHFMTISDDDAVAAMRALAAGSERDAPLVVGESGAAGFAGLIELIRNPEFSLQVGLGSASHVLVINTEGATAPGVYEALVGESAISVGTRQAAWMNAIEH